MKSLSARALLFPTAIASLLNVSAAPCLQAQQAAGAATGPSAHRTKESHSRSQNFSGSGSGELLAMIGGTGKQLGKCPLKKTEVNARISGYMSRVTVKQVFHNPFKEKIEAVYTFPLSETGAVDDMKMTVGKRVIRGLIKKREEARQIYETARAAGHVASLLDQERPNIFTQSVANIMPGESVEVTIQYVDLLAFEAGRFSFAFPTVVGPRFNPGTPQGKTGTGWSNDTTGVPDASLITPPVAEGRAGHDISIAVSIDAGVPISGITSKLHDVKVNQQNQSHASVELVNKATIPNKDFVLTWDVSGDSLKSGYLAHRPDKNKPGYFTLMILPPRRVKPEHIQPKEMVYVIDCSGSQSGFPLEKAKETMRYAIDHMNPDDTFQIIAFNNGATKLFDAPERVSDQMKQRALKFIAQLQARGGTWMAPAVEEACRIPADKNRLRIVTFMTDGYVGNDFEIIGMVKKYRDKSRWFPFGTGNSVNRFLIDSMAKEGGGEPEYVLLNSRAEDVGKKFYDRISSPVLTDVKLAFDGLEVKEVFPHKVEDVWAERPLYVKGRYYKPGAGTVTISGFSGGKPYEQKLKVNFPEVNSDNGVIGSIWARAKVDRLMSEDWAGAQTRTTNQELKDEIVKVALAHHIMTQYTSFVAVEEKSTTDGKPPRLVPVEVEMPDGVSREGVFGERSRQVASTQDGRAGGGGMARFNYAPNTYRLSQAKTRSSIVAQSPMKMPPPHPGAIAGMPVRGFGAAQVFGNEGSGNGPNYFSLAGGRKDSGGALQKASDLPRAWGGDESVARAPKAQKEVAGMAKSEEESNDKKSFVSSKIDARLVGLSQKTAKLGKSFRLNGVTVSDGKVKISVELKELSSEILRRLKLVGLDILIQAPERKMVTGRIDVDKLDDLALLSFVMRIKPADN